MARRRVDDTAGDPAGDAPTPGAAVRAMGRLLAQVADSGRLVRGYELFDDGLVGELVIDGDRVTGEVAGSRRWPYEVAIRLPGLAAASLPAAGRSMRFTCTCPDSGDPCKHGVAVALAAASHLDEHGPASDVGPADNFGEPDELAQSTDSRRPPVTQRRRRVSPPTHTPGWAEALDDAEPTALLSAWFGAEGPVLPLRVSGPGDPDPIELLLELGACVPEGGHDLSAAIQLFVLRLRGGA